MQIYMTGHTCNVPQPTLIDFIMKTKRTVINSLPIWVFALMVLAQYSLVACPNCKEGFDTGTTQAGVGSAYGFTIYLLIIVPVAIVVTLAMKIKRQMDANDKTAFYRS
jgi:hypothetical protein